MKTVITHEVAEIVGKIPIAIYLRVSSDKDDQMESYHAQKGHYETEFRDSPTHEIIGIYGDEGISGRTQRKRDEFNLMMVDARLGKFKTIYTKSIARFGRNNEETITALTKLRDWGVNVVFTVDGLDTKNLSQELLIKIKSILAEEESNTISTNVKHSYARRFKQGICNTINTCYGYHIDEDYNFTINEAEAKVVRLIYSLYLEGLGIIKIVHYLRDHGIVSPTGKEIWSKTTIDNILKNEKYIGDLLLQKSYTKGTRTFSNNGEVRQYHVENNHDPIITYEIYERVKAERTRRRDLLKENTLVTERYELSGKVGCGLCGKGFKRRINHKIKNFSQVGWICNTSNLHGVKACRANQISDDLLKEILVDCFNEYLATQHITPQVEVAKVQIAELVGREKNLRDLLDKGVITYIQFADEHNALKTEYDRLDKIIEAEQGSGLYKKQGQPRTEYTDDIVVDHIEKITIRGYAISVTFNNKQIIKARYKYEHRRYCKDTD